MSDPPYALNTYGKKLWLVFRKKSCKNKYKILKYNYRNETDHFYLYFVAIFWL